MEMGASPRWMQLERAALRRAASLPGRPCPTQLSGAGGAGWQLQDMGSAWKVGDHPVPRPSSICLGTVGMGAGCLFRRRRTGTSLLACTFLGP